MISHFRDGMQLSLCQFEKATILHEMRMKYIVFLLKDPLPEFKNNKSSQNPLLFFADHKQK